MPPVGVPEPAGTNCQHGGLKYTDAQGVHYVCNGAPGGGQLDSQLLGMLRWDRLPTGQTITVGASPSALAFDGTFVYVANEGILVAILPEAWAGRAIEVMRQLPIGAAATVIGRVTSAHPGMVVLRTGVGGTRVVDMLPGDQLPRIC